MDCVTLLILQGFLMCVLFGIILSETGGEETGNPCLLNNGGCGIHDCFLAGPGSRICRCNRGYILNRNLTCILEDPCTVDNGHCDFICKKIGLGTRKCYCEEGYAFNEEGKCVLDDPCTYNNGGCEFRCRRLGVGRHICGCMDGYLYDSNKRKCLERKFPLEILISLVVVSLVFTLPCFSIVIHRLRALNRKDDKHKNELELDEPKKQTPVKNEVQVEKSTSDVLGLESSVDPPKSILKTSGKTDRVEPDVAENIKKNDSVSVKGIQKGISPGSGSPAIASRASLGKTFDTKDEGNSDKSPRKSQTTGKDKTSRNTTPDKSTVKRKDESSSVKTPGKSTRTDKDKDSHGKRQSKTSVRGKRESGAIKSKSFLAIFFGGKDKVTDVKSSRQSLAMGKRELTNSVVNEKTKSGGARTSSKTSMTGKIEASDSPVVKKDKTSSAKSPDKSEWAEKDGPVGTKGKHETRGSKSPAKSLEPGKDKSDIRKSQVTKGETRI